MRIFLGKEDTVPVSSTAGKFTFRTSDPTKKTLEFDLIDD
jgi:hypothetical protein